MLKEFEIMNKVPTHKFQINDNYYCYYKNFTQFLSQHLKQHVRGG